MDSFSRRYGLEPEKLIQYDSMDERLRNGLWNGLQSFFWRHVEPGAIRGEYPKNTLQRVLEVVWAHFLGLRLDTLPIDWLDIRDELSSRFFSWPWHSVYSFVEFMARLVEYVHEDSKRFMDYCNGVLENERSAYRFVGRRITPITDEVEIKEIENALQSPYDAVRDQIHNAVKSLSEKPTPDCRTCIKESIGAVETAARLASNTEKGTLGGLLPILEEKLGLHPALVGGYKRLYGYTCDAKEGIRHAAMEKNNLSSDDARYWLVSCCAFANYLLRLAERAGLKPGN